MHGARISMTAGSPTTEPNRNLQQWTDTHVCRHVYAQPQPQPHQGCGFFMCWGAVCCGNRIGAVQTTDQGETTTAVQARDLEGKQHLLPCLCFVQKRLAMPGPLAPACRGTFRNS